MRLFIEMIELKAKTDLEGKEYNRKISITGEEVVS